MSKELFLDFQSSFLRFLVVLPKPRAEIFRRTGLGYQTPVRSPVLGFFADRGRKSTPIFIDLINIVAKFQYHLNNIKGGQLPIAPILEERI